MFTIPTTIVASAFQVRFVPNLSKSQENTYFK